MFLLLGHESLSDLESVEDVGMRPSQGLSGHLCARLLGNLLVNSSIIVLNMRINSGQDGVSSRLGSSNEIVGSGVLSKVEKYLPCLVIFTVIQLEVSSGLNLVLHGTGSVVEKFSESSG